MLVAEEMDRDIQLCPRILYACVYLIVRASTLSNCEYMSVTVSYEK